MSIYLRQKKIGYHTYQIVREGSGFIFKERTFFRIKILDHPLTVLVRTRCTVDSDLALKSFSFLLDADPTHYEIVGKATPRGIHIRQFASSGETEKFIPVAEGATYLSMSIPALIMRGGLKVGKVSRLCIFEPSTGQVMPMEIRIEAREEITTPRFKGMVYRIGVEYRHFQSRLWVDSNGLVHREESFPEMVLLSDTPVGARSGLGENDQMVDIARSNRVTIKNVIPDPRRARYLKLRIKGINTAEYDLEGGRQKITGNILEIRREDLKSIKSFNLPYSARRYQPYLADTMTIPSRSPRIRSQALEIIGKQKDAKTAAKSITEWVFRRLKKTPVVTVPNALEILELGRGDCNEHAVLLTALLRSVGVPVRICTGLVCMEDGFYYHTWNEAYVGSWVSLDATFNQFPSDATHIKLIQGDLDQQVRLMNVIGKIHIEVLSYEE